MQPNYHLIILLCKYYAGDGQLVMTYFIDRDCLSDVGGDLLLMLPLVIYRVDGGWFIDSQAKNGLIQWLKHFASVTLCVKYREGAAEWGLVPIDERDFGGRLKIVVFPTGWTPASHLKALPKVRRALNALIQRHTFLHFALMGGWGDWSALGIDLASRKGLNACVWTDRVESKVIALEASRHRGVKRLARWANAHVARRNERRAIGKAALGLFHGRDTFEHFQKFSSNPHLVHDIHVKPDDRVAADELAGKIANCREGPLQIIYAGRVHPDKGVMEWIETLRLAKVAGLQFEAIWLGDGPQLAAARDAVARSGLTGEVSFPGAVDDRQALLSKLRHAHLMLFCHLTPESPRCLIEALVSGTPIIGFGSAYSEDLIAAHGGGQLTSMSPIALAGVLVEIDRDRDRLAALIERSARDGYPMNDEVVFKHRADIMRKYQ